MEKTFREVIRDIRENEVWENHSRRVEMINGAIQISRVNGERFNDFIVCFSDVTLYKLKKLIRNSGTIII
ncbi:hypothetical protein [Clostridium sp.]|uniref:hypothetical protein n=1 Tax=Clostridium sp. TaxID=1506 RepID=UPI0029097257|nr:hypothetical protein [Clostridium sp.]MDU3410154.1 hypothetical protein [Clostridium sp.]